MSAIKIENHLDENGNPNGGCFQATGINIEWQKGALVDPYTGERKEQNGAFVQDVISAAIQRIEHYQTTKFACLSNEIAIQALKSAYGILNFRLEDRKKRGVEGTHTI